MDITVLVSDVSFRFRLSKSARLILENILNYYAFMRITHHFTTSEFIIVLENIGYFIFFSVFTHEQIVVKLYGGYDE
jgi:hypothetical protein